MEVAEIEVTEVTEVIAVIGEVVESAATAVVPCSADFRAEVAVRPWASVAAGLVEVPRVVLAGLREDLAVGDLVVPRVVLVVVSGVLRAAVIGAADSAQ